MAKGLLNNIVLGTGLGNIKFGMHKDEIKALLGEPDEVEIDKMEEGDIESWHYDEDEISLSFDEFEGWRLTVIAVSSEVVTLEGEKVIGVSEEAVTKLAKKFQLGELEREEVSDEDDEDSVILGSTAFSINFWFVENEVSEIQFGPFYNDDGSIEWPL